MYAMNLVDVNDARVIYGILLCYNDEITNDVIQKKIYEIKELILKEDVDWVIEDVINMLPSEWSVKLQSKVKRITI